MSKKKWIKAHEADAYVKLARQAGYRSRAVYKLAQIDARDGLFYPNMTVVDLGAAPGGWCQWVKQRLQDQVRLFAIDTLPMPPLPDVTFIRGDFREQGILDTLLALLEQQKVDLVMSDMAPNISGMKAIDQPRAILLAELARDLALDVLATQGHLLVKLFQGEGFDNYLQTLRPHFKQVIIRKPQASRARSREVYIVAKQYKGILWQ
jgi:23S rRNA (uridine2552-2'-O)-methyltransferase